MQQAVEAIDITCPDDPGPTCEEYIQQEREYVRLRCLGNEEIPPDVLERLKALGYGR